MVDMKLFILCATVFLGVTLYLGYVGYKQTKSADDYMIAGKKISPAVLALSYGSAFISTSAIIGFGGMSAAYGTGLMWLTVLCILVGVIIAFIFFGKRIRRLGGQLGAVTFPDLLGKRFDSPFMQYASAAMILIAMPLYCAAIIIGGANFIDVTFGIDKNMAILGFAVITASYVIFGGLIAVMYTDAMQGALILIGLTILLILTFVAVGGPIEGFTTLSEMSPQIPLELQEAGLRSWTAMPEFGSNAWLTLITTIVMGVGIGVLAQPQLTVRFLSAKDDRSINRAVAIGGPFMLLTTGIAFTVGPLTNVWFWDKQGQIALEAAGNDVDQIIPLFINNATPELYVVIFLLVLLAAAMSTLSSLFHAMGTTAGYDLYKHVSGRDRPSKRIAQLGTIAMIAVSVALAIIMPENIIVRATAIFMGLCASAFLPALTYAIYSKQPSSFPARLSLISGSLSWLIWTIFVHEAEAGALGICQALFGKTTLLGAPFTVINPLVIGLPIAIIALTLGLIVESRVDSMSEAEIA
ncbi:MAG: sodium:solute symporter family protein [Euryarchaeota archaeon]|nr:sodium:solute symporter family protein [Euryarchaeota archaeon]